RLEESYAGLEQKGEQRTSELSESLAQQTATSEVLQVISRSPGELAPVFQAMLKNATRICNANSGMLWRAENGGVRVVAFEGVVATYAVGRMDEPFVVPDPEIPLGQVIAQKRIVHVPDLTKEAGYLKSIEPLKTLVDQGGARSLLMVPMLREEDLIGAIAIYRSEISPFTDKQIELVQNFAAQAVIAIENVRLLNELRSRTDELARSVGELRALGEVSQAVNSTLNLETVLDTIVAKAVQLSNTDAGAIYVFSERDREFHLRATYGMEQGLIDALGRARLSA